MAVPRFREIPATDFIKDVEMRNILTAIRENQQILLGKRGDIKDQAALVSTLNDINLVQIRGSGSQARIFNPNPAAEAPIPSVSDISDTGNSGVLVGNLNATSGLAQGTHGLSVYLPNNAIVVRSYYEVQTTFVSGTDAATIALGINTDDAAGIVAAIAISDGTNPWDAGNHEGIQDGTAANFSNKTTSQRRLEAVIAGGEDLTDGELNLIVEYVISA